MVKLVGPLPEMPSNEECHDLIRQLRVLIRRYRVTKMWRIAIESDSGEWTGEEGPFEAAEYIVDMLPCEDKETISNAIKDYCNVQKQCRWRWGERVKRRLQKS